MVHALKLAHELLKPGGVLIDIHDLPAPHAIGVQVNDDLRQAGWLLDSHDFRSTRAACLALATIVDQGLFDFEKERDFTYAIEASSLPEMQSWLAEWWEDAILTGGVLTKLDALYRQATQPGRICLQVRTRMVKLLAAQVS